MFLEGTTPDVCLLLREDVVTRDLGYRFESQRGQCCTPKTGKLNKLQRVRT